MKHLVSILYCYVLLCLMMSCSHYISDSHSFGTQVNPSQKLSQPQFNDQQTIPTTTWDNIFRNAPDAQVNGYGQAIQIKITRLSESFLDEPLFVVNDRMIGKGFLNISHIDPNSVQRIKVLHRPNEISLYGNLGRHGVILIKTL